MLDFESQKNIKEDIIQAISQDKNLHVFLNKINNQTTAFQL